MNKDTLQVRSILLIVALVALMIVGVGRLYNLQIVKGEEYLRQSESKLTRSVTLEAPRGEILDRNGQTLVTNRTCFMVEFDAVSWRKVEDRANLIWKLIELCRANGQEYQDSLPVSATPPFSYTYAADMGSEQEEEIAAYLKKRDLPPDLSAAELINHMVERYEVPETYTPEQKRAIVGVRYEMELRQFSTTIPFVFAEDIEVALATKIQEQNRLFSCVSITVKPLRQYQTKNAAHILGRVGNIHAEQYQKLKDKGYRRNDEIGQDGMERYLEDWLRGMDGTQTIETTTSGKITNMVSEVAPVSGKECTLTIDSAVQAAAEDALAYIIPKLRREGLTNSHWGGNNSKGGAVVAIDVKTGGVLAMASNPTYDLTEFHENYNAMLQDPLKPMLNRAISGHYPPGSTFKMVTSLAALSSGTITPNTTVVDEGIYTYYKGYQPRCDIFKTYGKTHGSVNVSGAIKVSCNYFFYDVGRKTGISKIEETAKKFGFGSATGIELPGELKGQVAGYETRENAGGIWYDGDTLSAAIGQSDTLVTPLQLANYTAMLATRGTQYQPHLLRRVRDPETNEILFSETPTVLNQVEFEDAHWDVVLEGMYRAANEPDGTAYSMFKDYPIKVGAKTGSAQAPGGSHALFVAFAPFDDPEIAVAVVVENGGQGSRVTEVAKRVFDAYFFDTSNQNLSQTENILVQ
ncbi:MAG: penicillin-binding protein 2 [Oscillospiraceae bacterium]|nr:penicillin-binding protein 2 [Oscillospiraceae bacterium]